MTDKIYSFMGLATKAGKLISGEDPCERAIKSGKVYLVIVSEDASDNTKKKFTDMSGYRRVSIKFFGKKELLGRYTGKEIRAVIAITDEGFSKKLSDMIDSLDRQNGGE